MTYELDTDKRQAIIDGQIEDLKESILLNEINLVKWAAMEGDWTPQIANAEQDIVNAKAAIDALSDL